MARLVDGIQELLPGGAAVRRLLLLALFVGFALGDGVQYYSRFENTAADMSGYDRDSANVGSPTYESSHGSQAIVLDGTNGIVTKKFDFPAEDNGMMVAMWVKCESAASTQTFINIGGDGGADGWLSFWRVANTDNVRMDYKGANGQISYYFYNFFVGYQGEWVHLTLFVQCQVKGHAYLFRNGAAFNLPAVTDTLTSPLMPSDGQACYIGLDVNTRGLIGSLDDVMIASMRSFPASNTFDSVPLMRTYAQQAMLGQFPHFDSPKNIVCMGNSTTLGGGDVAGDSFSYPWHLQTWLRAGTTVRNFGWGSDYTKRMRQRFASMTDPPFVAVIMGGVNDLRYEETLVAGIQGNLQGMYDSASAWGATVVAMTCTPFGGDVYWTAARQESLDDVNDWIRAVPSNVDYVVDAYTALEDPAKPDTLLPAYDKGDHIHHSVAGATVLAESVYAVLHRAGEW